MTRGITSTLVTHEPCTQRVLTGLDRSCGALSVRQVLFFRRCPEPEALRGGLQALLHRRPVLGSRLGRDATGRLALLPSPRGVPLRILRHARLPACLRGSDTPRTVEPLIPPEVALRPLGDAPLLQVHLHVLPDGSGALAFAFSHHLADLRSLQATLRAWAAASRGEQPGPAGSGDPAHMDGLRGLGSGAVAAPTDAPTLLPEYTLRRRTLLHTALCLSRAHLLTRMRARVLRFGPEDLEALDVLGAPAGRSGRALLAAHVAQVLASLRGPPPTGRLRFTGVADLRARPGRPSHLRPPPEFWGNAILFSSAVRPWEAVAPSRGPEALLEAAAARREASSRLDEETVISEVSALERAVSRHDRLPMVRVMGRSFRDTVLVNDARHLPLYDLDFGTGRPHWLQTQQRAVPWSARLYLAPPEAPPGSVDAWLKLSPRAIAHLDTTSGRRLLRPWAG